MSEATDGTGDGLLDFLEWAGTRGEMPLATSKNLAGACRAVLAVEPDPGAVNVVQFDPDDIFGRFETLNRTNYTTESMNTYRSRFFKSISMYRAWLDKRPDWKSMNGRPQTRTVAVRGSSSIGNGNGNGRPASRSWLRRLSRWCRTTCR
jgi:hypothetical protein